MLTTYATADQHDNSTK